MRKSLLAAIILCGCTQTISSNPDHISIKTPPALQKEAYEKAQTHCNQYGKNAVPSGEIQRNTVIYRCE